MDAPEGNAPANESAPLVKISKKASLFRSSKFYLPLLTSFVIVICFSLYFFFYISSQNAYYNERAFRMLSNLGAKFLENYRTIQTVLAASTSKTIDENSYGRYVTDHLESFSARDPSRVPKSPKVEPSRTGLLTLSYTDEPDSMAFSAQYREGDADKAVASTARVDLQPATWSKFDKLSEGFFDDILIADSSGRVLYQHSPAALRITNLNTLINSSVPDPASARGQSTQPEEAAPRAEKGKALASRPRSRFAEISEFSNVVEVKPAGATYKLYLHPLPVMIKVPSGQAGMEDSRLVLCGLRSAPHVRAETVALPYTHLIWGSLILMAALALMWPVLKVAYMSPKERLRRKHVVTLVLSTFLAAALLALAALNVSYSAYDDTEARKQLKDLNERIKKSIAGELAGALDALAAVSSSDYLRRHVTDTWKPVPRFLSEFLADGSGFSKTQRDAIQAYPFFHYMFWLNERGEQRFKIAVAQPTPPVSIEKEAYFQDVLRDNLAASQDGKYHFRLQPAPSPNTGEFFVVLATRFTHADTAPSPLDALKASVLVTRFESLVDPLVPSGLGYAVVNRDGIVQFHSNSIRNLIEDFVKECRSDPALLALLATGSEDFLDTIYTGRRQLLLVTPLQTVGLPGLSLIAFRDRNYFDALHVTVVLVFTLIVVFYSIPLVLFTLIHVSGKEYPLESVWPSRNRMGDYIHMVAAYVFLAMAFFSRYDSFDEGATLRLTALLGFAGALIALLQMMGGWLEILGRAVVFTVLVAFTYPDAASMILLPGLFVLYHFSSARFERYIRRKAQLRHVYTLAVLSLLTVAVVAPCCGFFKVAYESIHRLSLEREQLLLSKKIADRRERIHRYYRYELNLPPDQDNFEKIRIGSPLDRYDYAVLNIDSGSARLSRAGSLDSLWFQKLIAQLSGIFPSTQGGAELRALALAEPVDARWILAGRTPGDSTLLGLERPPFLTDDPRVDVLSLYPVWGGLSGEGVVVLAVAGLILGGWIFMGTKKVFLADVENAPQLDRREADSWIRYRLIIGHPKSGKSTYAKAIPGIQIVDIGKLAATGDWSLIRPLPRVVGIDRFEFDIDNPDTNAQKLHLLEELIYAESCPVVILSTVDPMFYLAAESPQSVCKTGDLRAAMLLLDRWAAVLSLFQRLRVEDVTVKQFGDIVRKMEAKHSAPGFQRFIKLVEGECGVTAQLRNIGATLLRIHRRDATMVAPAKLAEEVLDRAEVYYRVLWSTCTKDERLALFQLAQDGWANPNNARALRELQRRGVILRGAGFRIMNESFRRFILNSQYPEEIAEWEQEEQQSLWKAFKLSLITACVLLTGWLVYAQQEMLSLSLGYVSGFLAAAGIIVKLLSDFRGRSTVAGASK